MIITKYKVYDDKNVYHGTFNELKHAQEHAQEMADETKLDMYIEKITTELIECVCPE